MRELVYRARMMVHMIPTSSMSIHANLPAWLEESNRDAPAIPSDRGMYLNSPTNNNNPPGKSKRSTVVVDYGGRAWWRRRGRSPRKSAALTKDIQTYLSTREHPSFN